MRRENDFYPTPAWCVDRLLDAVAVPGHRWLEPCSGKRSICHAVNEWRKRQGWEKVQWTTVDINPDCNPDRVADFVFMNGPLGDEMFDAVVTNPPYSLAFDFIKQSLRHAPFVAALLRLNWLASSKRHEWLQRNTPDVFVLPDRPSFTGDGATDSSDYAWMVWRNGIVSGGSIYILDRTPVNQRRLRDGD